MPSLSINGGLSIREIVTRTWRGMNDHEIMTRASAVSFYAMLASVPFLALVLTLAVQLLPDVTRGFSAAKNVGDRTVVQLEGTLRSIFPENAYKVVEEQIVRMQKTPPIAILSIGLLVALWTASELFVALIDALNRIEGVKESRSLVRVRLVAIKMTLIEVAVLVGSLALILIWPVLLRWMGLSTFAAALMTILQWVGLFFVVLLSFAFAFYTGPACRRPWRFVTPGGLVGTIGFLLASLGFRVYIQNWTNYDKTYGSLGGVMVLMFWLWITSLVLLVAAQMNKVIDDATMPRRCDDPKIDAGA